MRATTRLAGLLVTTLTLAVGTVTATGCQTYREQLIRSQHVFEQSDYERALALLKELERDVTKLEPPQQAQYAYLRGMTDYRIGYRPDARHWLAVARTYEETSPGTLPNDWKTRMNEALEEMNGVVLADGLSALATTRRPGEDEPPASKPVAAPAAPPSTPALSPSSGPSSGPSGSAAPPATPASAPAPK